MFMFQVDLYYSTQWLWPIYQTLFKQNPTYIFTYPPLEMIQKSRSVACWFKLLDGDFLFLF